MEKRNDLLIHKELYTASSKRPKIVDVPELQMLSIDGEGHPESDAFQIAISTLYPAAFFLKFFIRQRKDVDYKVMPMEVKWRLNRDEKRFFWTIMLMTPEIVTQQDFADSNRQLFEKKGTSHLDRLRLSKRAGGECLQIMHLGDYLKMNDTFGIVRGYAQEHRLEIETESQDIYLNSIKKAKVENLKTIIRVRITKH